MTYNVMGKHGAAAAPGEKGPGPTALTVWPRTSSKIPRKSGPPWPNWRAGRPSSPVAALVAAQVSAAPGSQARGMNTV